MSGTISATTAALIAAAVGAAGTGAGIFESVKSGDENASNQAAQKQELLQQQEAQANQANLTKQEAVLGESGQVQAQTGGSLTDSGTAALTDLLAGYPGYQSGSSGTGATPATTSAVAPTTLSPGGGGGGGGTIPPNIAAILAALRSGAGGTGGPGTLNLSGGNWQSQPPQPQAWQELANPVL
jgi:hypothetical protein